MARKTRRPPSWLGLVRDADFAFTGLARVVSDVPVGASETSFRGPGFRVSAEVTLETKLFGSPPGPPQLLSGETRRPPEGRLSLAELPDDPLHERDYWDYARHGTPLRVLVIDAEPAAVKALADDDALPAAVIAIRDWTGLPAESRGQTVIAGLDRPDVHPVAFVAGFELLLESAESAALAWEQLKRLGHVPAVAVGAMLRATTDRLAGSSPGAIGEVVSRLLDRWSGGGDSQAMAAVVTWLDGAGSPGWESDPALRARVLALLDGAAAAGGAAGDRWAAQLREQAALLRSRITGAAGR